MPLTMLEPMVAPAPKIAVEIPDLLVHMLQNRGICGFGLDESTTRTNQGRMKEKNRRTSIPHLLPKLLPMLIKLALPSRLRTRTPLRDIHRHIPIRCPRRRRNSHGTLLIHNLHIAPGKDPFHARPLIPPLGPIRVHEFGD
ncbi:MAG: hypothetical protein Q9183_005977 [Haloplaca sp. 2 TL-2023]